MHGLPNYAEGKQLCAEIMPAHNHTILQLLV